MLNCTVSEDTSESGISLSVSLMYRLCIQHVFSLSEYFQNWQVAEVAHILAQNCKSAALSVTSAAAVSNTPGNTDFENCIT